MEGEKKMVVRGVRQEEQMEEENRELGRRWKKSCKFGRD